MIELPMYASITESPSSSINSIFTKLKSITSVSVIPRSVLISTMTSSIERILISSAFTPIVVISKTRNKDIVVNIFFIFLLDA